jgi:NAD(P)-dependent dehydrogenase (short-subunit alcohol dehydrogenase family)
MTQKTALVTGAGRELGLGFATARLLAEQDHHVVVTARDRAQAEARAAEIRADGGSASAALLDLTDTASFSDLAATVAAEHGRLDVLVNNASTMPDMDVRSLLDADVDAVRLGLEIDVVAPLALVQAFRPLLVASPAGRVVNVSSAVWCLVEAAGPTVFSPAHAFAKHTLNVLSRTLAGAFTGTDVLVNAVDPAQVASHPEFGVDPEDVPAIESAKWVAWAATLPAGGPTGLLFREGEAVGRDWRM